MGFAVRQSIDFVWVAIAYSPSEETIRQDLRDLKKENPSEQYTLWDTDKKCVII